MTQFFLNELSLHGQYTGGASFIHALRVVTEARRAIDQAGFPFFCDSRIGLRNVIGNVTFEHAVRASGNKEVISNVLSWLSKTGPFWAEEQQHSSDDLFGCGDLDITESTLAEAACRHSTESPSRSFSFSPSQLNYTPLVVIWTRRTGGEVDVPVENLWDLRPLEEVIRGCARPLENWLELRNWAQRTCDNLLLSPDVIEPVLGEPFSRAASEEIQMLLRILNEISVCHDAAGALSERGQELLRIYFQGHHPRFTNEAPNVKFIFKHPASGVQVLCSWHGKVRLGLQYRIHFEWPKPPGGLLWVSYIGPKLTKG